MQQLGTLALKKDCMQNKITGPEKKTSRAKMKENNFIHSIKTAQKERKAKSTLKDE